MCCIKIPSRKPVRYKKAETSLFVIKELHRDSRGYYSPHYSATTWKQGTCSTVQKINWVKVGHYRRSGKGYYAYWGASEIVHMLSACTDNLCIMRIPIGTKYYTDGKYVIAEQMEFVDTLKNYIRRHK